MLAHGIGAGAGTVVGSGGMAAGTVVEAGIAEPTHFRSSEASLLWFRMRRGRRSAEERSGVRRFAPRPPGVFDF